MKGTGLRRIKAHLLGANHLTSRDHLHVCCEECSEKTGLNVLRDNMHSLIPSLSAQRQKLQQLGDHAIVQSYDLWSVPMGSCSKIVAHPALRSRFLSIQGMALQISRPAPLDVDLLPCSHACITIHPA